MENVSFILGTFALLASTAGAQEYLQYNFWVRPPNPGIVHDYAQDIAWRWGSDQAVQWHSTWPVVNVKIYQNNNSNFWILTPNNVPGDGYQTLPYNATFPQYFLDRRLPLIFFLRIDNVQNDSQAFSSHYFNLVDAPSSLTAHTPSKNTPHSSLPLKSTPTSTPTGTPSSTPSSAPASPSTSPPNSAHSTGLSIGAEAGIGAGAAIVLIAIICSLVALVYYRRKAKAARAYAAACESDRMGHRTVYVPMEKVATKPTEDFGRGNFSQRYYTSASGPSEAPSQHQKSPRELP